MPHIWIEMYARTKDFMRHTRFLIVDEPSGSQHERIVNWDVAGERLSTPSKRFAKCRTSSRADDGPVRIDSESARLRDLRRGTLADRPLDFPRD